MSNRVKYIFIYICIFSVFSLTLQASVLSFCKESKVFKSQGQSNPVTEEEEESHDSDETPDEEFFYADNHSLFHSIQSVQKLTWAGININYPCHSKTILVPPPRH